MIDRRQILVGTAVSLVAAHITPVPWPASGPTPELYASHWDPTRCFDVGDQCGYVVDSFMRRKMIFFTVVVTKVSAARGGWMFDMQSVGRSDMVLQAYTPPDEYRLESARHLWHLIKISPRRRWAR